MFGTVKDSGGGRWVDQQCARSLDIPSVLFHASPSDFWADHSAAAKRACSVQHPPCRFLEQQLLEPCGGRERRKIDVQAGRLEI